MANQDILINRYIGCDVDILYLTDNSAFHDRGVIEECDERWIALRKPGSELFLVPISAIRLVKMLDKPKEPGSVLLRPAEHVEEEQRLSAKE